MVAKPLWVSCSFSQEPLDSFPGEPCKMDFNSWLYSCKVLVAAHFSKMPDPTSTCCPFQNLALRFQEIHPWSNYQVLKLQSSQVIPW